MLNFALESQRDYPSTNVRRFIVEGESKSRNYIRLAAQVLLGLILVAVLVFFAAKLVQNRRDTKVAQDAAKTSKSADSQNSGQNSDNSGENEDSTTNNGSGTGASIPSGVADSDDSADGQDTAMPNVGMNQNALFFATILLMLVSYGVTRRSQVAKTVD